MYLSQPVAETGRNQDVAHYTHDDASRKNPLQSEILSEREEWPNPNSLQTYSKLRHKLAEGTEYNPRITMFVRGGNAWLRQYTSPSNHSG